MRTTARPSYFLFILTKFLIKLQARFSILIFLLVFVRDCVFFCVLAVTSCEVIACMCEVAYVRLLGPERHKAETGAKG